MCTDHKSLLFFFSIAIAVACEPSQEISSTKESTYCPWEAPADLLIDSLAATHGSYRELNVDEVQQDLDCLAATISRHYVASHFYDHAGYSLVEAIEDLSRNIGEPLKQDELMDLLLEAHGPAYDTHAAYRFRDESRSVSFDKRLRRFYLYRIPISFSRVSTSPDAFVSEDGSIVVSSCDSFEPFRHLNGKFTFVGQFQDRVDRRSVACLMPDTSSPSFALEAIEVQSNDLIGISEEFSYEMEQNHLYVRIPQMTSGVSPEQQALLEFIDSTLATDEFSIIFDLRQNGGGDDTFAYELGESLRVNSERNPALELTDMESLYATASSTNLVFLKWQTLLATGDDSAPRLEEKYLRYLAHFESQIDQGHTLSTPATVSSHVSTNGRGKRTAPWSKPIVLVVDKNCASSCESMIEIFRTIPQAVVIGTHTGGLLSFGNIGVAMLPNSKIGFQGGWRYFRSSGEEGLGYAPDIYDVGDDILRTARDYIAN